MGGCSMRIYGLQKLSMVDYPGKIAATVFAGGCNLRCPFCHNALLVTRLDESVQLETEQVLQFLRSRRGLLDGVVLSGGEPLLQSDAADFLRQVKEMGFAVKLDTNGCYPDALAAILAEGLVDYVAMDIKNAPGKYAQTVGLPTFDTAAVEASCRILRESGIDYEYRTTVVSQLHTAEDIRAIGVWLQGAPRYYLQNFEDSGNLISTGLSGFTEEQMNELAAAAGSYFGAVQVRGF